MKLPNAWRLLLLAVPLAFALRFAGAGPLPTFAVAALGIIPLAALMGTATESVARFLGPSAGGLLNATFGNAAELILGLVALRRGMFAVVKASLAGSIIGNALLVLGVSLLVGGLRHRRQTFDRVTASLQSTLLVLAALGMTLPSVLFDRLSPATERLFSLEIAGILLATYVLSLVFMLVTNRQRDAELMNPPAGEHAAAKPLHSAIVLAVSSGLVAFLSEFLVGALADAQRSGLLAAWNMSEMFLGVVVIAVIGNVAEHSSAVLMAFRNQVGLSLHIAVGSSLQIALLVTPLLVFASQWLAPQPLDLHFSVLEVMAVGASVVVVALVAADGESHWMEGVLLVAAYLILALAFYHFPAANQ